MRIKHWPGYVGRASIEAHLRSLCMHDCIGILGGMGPLATVDLMGKIIAATPATRDQDHVPLIVYSVPQIPDRLTALRDGDDAPWPHLLDGVHALERAGARA